MIKDADFNIIGIDGGASNTRGVLINQNGNTLSTAFEEGTNLAVYGELAAKRIINVISSLCESANISFDSIDAIGLGLAGASHQEGREEVFKKLDALNLSKRTLIANDAEAAYVLSCPMDLGILVTVGTGVICISRNEEGKTIRIAGTGHDKGDVGSGFWMGKQVITNLALNETSVIGDQYLEQLMEIFLETVGIPEFNNAIEKIYEHDDQIKIIAKLAKPVIDLSEKGNEIALSIVQEATHSIANYIESLLERINYSSNKIVLAGNGSVIRNNYYRKSVNDELRFHFSDIKWTFSKISSAYGASIMAGKLYDIDIKVSDILKGKILAAT